MQWHDSIEAVFHMELGEEAEKLTFEREHQLSSKPLEIDLLMIKKNQQGRISKNIGKIFKTYNVVEYKSPKDYLTVNDFYKAYGYACIYQADTKHVCEIPPSEITITLISKNFPRKMVDYLIRERRLTVRKIENGIYYLDGDQFKIQLLVNKQLSKEANYWLNSLRDDLQSGDEIQEFIRRYETEKQNKWCEDIANIILRGNWKKVEESKKMCEALRELFKDELEEAETRGLARGEEIGEARGQAIGEARGQAIGEAHGQAIGEARGILQGERTGAIRGKVESILELLQEHGTLPSSLESKIKSQDSTEILTQWLKLAAKTESIEAFERSIS